MPGKSKNSKCCSSSSSSSSSSGSPREPLGDSGELTGIPGGLGGAYRNPWGTREFSLSQLVPACPSLSQLVPACPSLSQLVPDCPSLSQLVPACPSSVPDETRTSGADFGPQGFASGPTLSQGPLKPPRYSNIRKEFVHVLRLYSEGIRPRFTTLPLWPNSE